MKGWRKALALTLALFVPAAAGCGRSNGGDKKAEETAASRRVTRATLPSAAESSAPEETAAPEHRPTLLRGEKLDSKELLLFLGDMVNQPNTLKEHHAKEIYPVYAEVFTSPAALRAKAQPSAEKLLDSNPDGSLEKVWEDGTLAVYAVFDVVLNNENLAEMNGVYRDGASDALILLLPSGDGYRVARTVPLSEKQ